jgi:cell division protein FtsB
MSFKKSFFGGYNKAAVDAFIEQHNEKIDNLKEKESDLTDTIAQKNSEIANLSLEIEKMKSEIEKINAENSALKMEANRSHLIFENVAKIYERAYDAGHNIVLDSKTYSDQMRGHMNQLFYAASNSVNETIAKQNNLKQEFTSLYEKVNSLVTELTNSTNALFKGAEEYISVFDVFKDIKTTTAARAETHLKEFEDFASEFLTAEETGKENTVAEVSDNEVVPFANKDEQIISPVAQSDETFTPFIYEAKDNIVSEANEESFSQQEENDQIVLSQEETAEDEISDAATSEEIATPTDVKPSEEEVITPVIKLQETGNTNVTEENNKAQEFTQFGRKSRVSSESREELIRKALLKNGAM